MSQRLARIWNATPRRYDFLLLGTTLCLVSVGVVMVFSASGVPADERLGNALYYLNRQALWAGLGLVALLVAAHVPYERLATLAPLVLLGSIGLLVAVQLPGIGATRGGATRWIGFGGVTFQPSEVAKLALVFYLARYYAGRKHLDTFADGIGKPALLCTPLIVLVLLQPDYGTAVAMVILFGVVALAAGVRMRHLALTVAATAPALAGLALLAPYRMRRLSAFLDPWQDMSDSGFQVIQSFVAFAGGGLLGRGLGDGMQKLYFLPEAHSDFVLALLGEELGVFGVIAVLGAFAILVGRGLGTALEHGDTLGRLLAVGLTAVIGLQALINCGVVMGLLPTKGITLPFVSYGGSSMLVMMTAVGILMNVSAQRLSAERETPAAGPASQGREAI